MPHDPIYTADEATKILRVGSPRTLERWRSDGTGPAFVKIGLRVGYTESALDKFIKQNTHIALAEKPSDRQLRDLFYTIQKEYFGLDVASFGDDMRGAQNEIIADIMA